MPGAAALQIPAVAFSLARLARFGPWFPDVVVFLKPAVALAVDHNELKASPPEEVKAFAVGLAMELAGCFAPRIEG